MILQQILQLSICIYYQTLLKYSQELYRADALAHARNHLLVQIDKILDLGPVEKACANYRKQAGPGAPATYSVSLLVRAILIGWLYGLSLRELEERMHYDLLVNWFVGCELGDSIPDHTTLGRFELWLIQNQPELFFSTILNLVDQQHPNQRQLNQVGDTYAMLMRAADENLVRRIRHICLRLMMELERNLPSQFEKHFQGFEWHQLYGPKPESATQLLSKQARAERLEQTVLGALDFRQRVVEVLASQKDCKHSLFQAWLDYLDKVLSDEVKIEYDENQKPVGVTELPGKDKGSFRMVSATDPEASIRNHGSAEGDVRLGYNVQMAATTEGFVRETKAYTGCSSDSIGVPELLAEQIRRQQEAGQTVVLPPKLIYDMAAGTGKTIAAVWAASNGLTQLVSKLINYHKNNPLYNPYDFQLSEDGQSLTCPNGQVSIRSEQKRQRDERSFTFTARQCWQGEPPSTTGEPDQSKRCPLWESCRNPKHTPHTYRTVSISDFRQHFLDATAYNQTEEFRQTIRHRPMIERIVFEVTNYCGARRCRRHGLAAADYQAKMSAAIYNLKLLIRKSNPTRARRKAEALAG